MAAGVLFGGIFIIWLATYLFGWFRGVVILLGIVIWFFGSYLPNWEAQKKYDAELAARVERARLERERQGKS